MITTYSLPCIAHIKAPYTKDVTFTVKSSRARNRYTQSYNQSLSKFKENYNLEFVKLNNKQGFIFNFIDDFIVADTFALYFTGTKFMTVSITDIFTKEEVVSALYAYLANDITLPVGIAVSFTIMTSSYITNNFYTLKSNDNTSLMFSNKLEITQPTIILDNHTKVSMEFAYSVQELVNVFTKHDNNSNISWTPIPENTLKYLRLPTNWEITKDNNIDNRFNLPKYNLNVTLESYY